MSTKNAINNASGGIAIDPGASGDSVLQFDINGTGEFRIGVDDDDSDKFKVSQGSALGSNDTFIITAAGEITKPLQPAFLARLGTTDSNVTGDGTAFTLGSGNALTEIYDQNSDFATSGTFTAPVTGRYFFNFAIRIGDVDASSSQYLSSLVTSNATYNTALCSGANYRSYADILMIGSSVFCDMDASDTATVQVTVSGTTKTLDVGALQRHTFISGYLVC